MSCMSCLYIFEINSLSVASFAIIFSHFEGCLFLLLFSIFWEVGHRGSCCDLCQRMFCLCSPLGVL